MPPIIGRYAPLLFSTFIQFAFLIYSRVYVTISRGTASAAPRLIVLGKCVRLCNPVYGIGCCRILYMIEPRMYHVSWCVSVCLRTYLFIMVSAIMRLPSCCMGVRTATCCGRHVFRAAFRRLRRLHRRLPRRCPLFCWLRFRHFGEWRHGWLLPC